MSASHNPGGPEYDWGIKVMLVLCSGTPLLLLILNPNISWFKLYDDSIAKPC